MADDRTYIRVHDGMDEHPCSGRFCVTCYQRAQVEPLPRCPLRLARGYCCGLPGACGDC